jgi:hypothetical protein
VFLDQSPASQRTPGAAAIAAAHPEAQPRDRGTPLPQPPPEVGAQYPSVADGEQLADVQILLSVEWVRDAFANALVEPIIGLFKANVIMRPGRCGNTDDVEGPVAWRDEVPRANEPSGRSAVPHLERSVDMMSMPADAGDVLLEVRLRPPPRSPDLLRRPELVDRLIAGSDLPLVALTAPAGYGKSSLLVEWANAEQRPVAWLSLRPGDGEPDGCSRSSGTRSAEPSGSIPPRSRPRPLGSPSWAASCRGSLPRYEPRTLRS